ncbi:lipopolysaccharide export system permease protein [Mesorhizobium sp. J18]|uniref:LPS export ABC transporter permease LptF n=1 Tax=Mesorhizobium sp. J18 TaxID=935263 RepID=UPI00119B8486|nr:LPS export ABC transporter permease LptF [Mesorhizobium sp. J18]TWG93753.1 lipopolysaccharide export system permease protein [Mesorhizobium sp. J18]
MKVVELYIMRRTFGIFLATLVWVLAIVWTTQVLNRIDLVTDSGQSAATFFLVAALVLPAVIPIVMPFAIGIAVAHTLATMNTDSELVVISAAGGPRTTIIRPIMIIAILASLVSFSVHNLLEPYSRQAFRELIAGSRADLISTVLQEGSFQKVDDGLFVQIGQRLPDGQLGGIFVADSREENVELIYHAKRGATVEHNGGSVLVMQDGVVQRKAQNGDISIIHFDAYAFDLSQFESSADGEPRLFPKDRSLAYLLDPDPNDRIFQRNPQRYRAELHLRLSDWLYPIVFALIGLAVAGDARSFREARMHPMLTTLSIALVVRWAGFYAGNEAETVPFFSFVLYAVPVLAAIVAMGFIATGKVMELPVSWTEKFATQFQKISDRLLRLRLRLAAMRRRAARGRA